jgi:hypothetical protein
MSLSPYITETEVKDDGTVCIPFGESLVGKKIIINIQFLHYLLESRSINFIQDLLELPKNPNFTAADFGKKHNITRERVRQIFFKLYSIPYRAFDDAWRNKINKDVAEQDSCAPQMKKYDIESPADTTFSILKKVCDKYKLELEPSQNPDVSALINGFSVYFFANKHKKSFPTNDGTIEYYCFRLNKVGEADRRRGKKKIDKCFYAIAYDHMWDIFYVIPKNKLDNKAYLYLRAFNSLDEALTSNHKYSAYIEKWMPIKAASKEEQMEAKKYYLRNTFHGEELNKKLEELENEKQG